MLSRKSTHLPMISLPREWIFFFLSSNIEKWYVKFSLLKVKGCSPLKDGATNDFCLSSYGLQIDTISLDFKSGLETLLKEKPIRAIFLGVRIGDPTAVSLVLHLEIPILYSSAYFLVYSFFYNSFMNSYWKQNFIWKCLRIRRSMQKWRFQISNFTV